MKKFQSQIRLLPGTNYAEIYPKALALYKSIASKTKRRPYIRSAYFNKEKVFLDYFWDHIRGKNLRDRARRLKFYPCGLDLLQHSHIEPTSKENPNKKSEILYRFSGITRNGDSFSVQVKKDKKRQKHFMSIFPFQ